MWLGIHFDLTDEMQEERRCPIIKSSIDCYLLNLPLPSPLFTNPRREKIPPSLLFFLATKFYLIVVHCWAHGTHKVLDGIKQIYNKFYYYCYSNFFFFPPNISLYTTFLVNALSLCHFAKVDVPDVPPSIMLHRAIQE